MIILDKIEGKAWLVVDDIVFVDIGAKETWYTMGLDPPRNKLPAVICPAAIDGGMVYISAVDEWHRCAPVITWYNESWGIPLPSDHGVADYSPDLLMQELIHHVEHH